MFCQSPAPNGAPAGMQKHDEPVDWGRVVHKKRKWRVDHRTSFDMTRIVSSQSPCRRRLAVRLTVASSASSTCAQSVRRWALHTSAHCLPATIFAVPSWEECNPDGSDLVAAH